MSANVQTYGKFPRCTRTHTVVLFEVQTGEVHHLHCAFLFDGPGMMPSPDVLEAVARRSAAHRQGRKGRLPRLEALHIQNAALGPGPHRVDLATRRVVSGAAARSVP
jgi:hypothetical protein